MWLNLRRRFTENITGNTNIPQFGAVGTRNSRDTLVGEDQFSEEQKRERGAQKHGFGPAPGRSANATARVPGQTLDPDDEKDAADHHGKRARESGAKRPPKKHSREAAKTAERNDREALSGHANTGHSPSNAT